MISFRHKENTSVDKEYSDIRSLINAKYGERPLHVNQSMPLPHLFVYQEIKHNSSEEINKPQNSNKNENVYFCPVEANILKSSAIQHITNKYDSIRSDVDGHIPKIESGIWLSDDQIFRIRSFLGGHSTEVYVCPTLANVSYRTRDGDWIVQCTGAPVFLFEPGNTKARDKRRLKLVICDTQTGFVIWADTIDNLSNYRGEDADFHVFHYGSDHRVLVGLRFANAAAAEELLQKIQLLASDPTNIALSAPKSKSKTKLNSKHKRLPKNDISEPCCFSHVTSVRPDDHKSLMSLQNIAPSSAFM